MSITWQFPYSHKGLDYIFTPPPLRLVIPISEGIPFLVSEGTKNPSTLSFPADCLKIFPGFPILASWLQILSIKDFFFRKAFS